jgi:hypothetical protein
MARLRQLKGLSTTSKVLPTLDAIILKLAAGDYW